jgi:hypothetical protein
MYAITRRKLEMGRRALEFGRAHPDASAGYGVALAQLEDRLAQADRLATQQRDGILGDRAAAARKRELRRALTQGHLAHLIRVAREAASELPKLEQTFVLPRTTRSYQAFRTAARAMASAAESNRELLVTHGLGESVLEDLARLLDELDAAVRASDEARRVHVGATAKLVEVAAAVVAAVEVMHGFNRVRFAGDAEALAAWESASSVVGSGAGSADEAAPPTPAAPGEVKPAA